MYLHREYGTCGRSEISIVTWFRGSVLRRRRTCLWLIRRRVAPRRGNPFPPSKEQGRGRKQEREKIVSRREYCYANWISMTSHRSSLPIRNTWESRIFPFPGPRIAGSFALFFFPPFFFFHARIKESFRFRVAVCLPLLSSHPSMSPLTFPVSRY